MELEYEGVTTAKPWLNDIDEATPRNFKGIPGGSEPPTANLTLEYVYGYRAFDTRNNLRFTPFG